MTAHQSAQSNTESDDCKALLRCTTYCTYVVAVPTLSRSSTSISAQLMAHHLPHNHYSTLKLHKQNYGFNKVITRLGTTGDPATHVQNNFIVIVRGGLKLSRRAKHTSLRSEQTKNQARQRPQDGLNGVLTGFKVDPRTLPRNTIIHINEHNIS
jgi:hypothetical protein